MRKNGVENGNGGRSGEKMELLRSRRLPSGYVIRELIEVSIPTVEPNGHAKSDQQVKQEIIKRIRRPRT